MRALISIVVATVAVVLVTAAPALAQKDPFDPLVTEADVTGGETTGATEEDDAGAVDQPAGRESLPNTGADTTSWLGVALALMAAGAGIVAAVRVLTTPPRPRP